MLEFIGRNWGMMFFMFYLLTLIGVCAFLRGANHG